MVPNNPFLYVHLKLLIKYYTHTYKILDKKYPHFDLAIFPVYFFTYAPDHPDFFPVYPFTT